MTTSRRIAAAILITATLTGCTADTDDDDSPQENVTTDPTEEGDDETDD